MNGINRMARRSDDGLTQPILSILSRQIRITAVAAVLALNGCAAVAPGFAVMGVDSAISESTASSARDADKAQREVLRSWVVSSEPGKPAVLTGPGIRIVISSRAQPQSRSFVLALHLWSETPGFALDPGAVALRMEAQETQLPAQYAEADNDAACLDGATGTAQGAFLPVKDRVLAVRERGYCVEILYPTQPPGTGQRYSVDVKGLTKSRIAVGVPEVDLLWLGR